MTWESLFCRSHFSLSLDIWSFAKVLMLDLACVKNIACLLGEKKKKKRTRRKESVCPFERTGGSVPVGLKDSCCHSQELRFSRPLVWATSDSSSKLSASPGRRPIPSSCTSLLQVWALGCSQGSLMPLQVLMDSSKSRNAPSHHLLLRQPRGRYLKDAAQKYSICCSRSGHQVLQGR